MAVKAPPSVDQPQTQFKRRLARQTILQLLLLTMIPFLVMGTIVLLRLRSQQEQQVTTQIRSISNYYAEQLTQLAKSREDSLETLLRRDLVIEDLPLIVSATTKDAAYSTARFHLQTEFSSYTAITADAMFDQLVVIRPDGTVAYATYDSWEDEPFGDLPFLAPFLAQDYAQLIFNPQPLYNEKFVLLTSRVVRDESGKPIATLLGTTLSAIPQSLMNYTEVLLPSAKSYYYTGNQDLIGLESEADRLGKIDVRPEQKSVVETLIGQNSQKLQTIQSIISGAESFALAKEIPELHTYILFSIPTETIYSQIQVINPGTLAIFLVALVLVGLIINFGVKRLVKPLEILSNITQQFARGNWEQRAVINRNDELGLLAFSFNQMANDLRELYLSLEAKVEERSHQLRTASEVALLATSGTNRDEMMQQAVNLLKDRFNFFYSAIYMLDETGEYATLRAAATTDEALQIPANLRVQVGSQSVVGQVAAKQSSMIISDLISEDVFKSPTSVMIKSASEASVPMMLGSDMLGVIDVQSQEIGAFDADTLVVLQTLANQLATGLRNVLLVESSQVNLEETSVLYRASRQISQSSNENEVLNILTDTLSKTVYVAILLSVESDNLKIVSFNDPKHTVVGGSLAGISLPMQRGAARLAENPLLLIDDLQASGDFENLTTFLARRGCRSAALIPINESRRATKLLVLGTRESNPLSSTRLQPYVSLAEVASTSLDRFVVLKTLQERLNDLQVLEYVGQAVSAETDSNQLYRTLNEIISDQIGSDLSFAIAIYNIKRKLIEIPYMISNGKQMESTAIPMEEGLTAYVLKTQKPLLLNSEVEKTAQSLGATSIGILPKSWLGIPLVVAGTSIGAIIVQDLENENRFEQSDLNLFNTIAPQIATAIRNSQLLSEMSATLNAFEQEHFLLDMLLTNIPDHVMFKDRDLRYLRVSQSLIDDFGRQSSEDFIGKDDAQLIGGEQGQDMMAAERQILEAGEPVTDLVEKLVDESNEETWRAISKLPMVDWAGNTFGLLGISRDITAVKKAEELAQIRAQRLLTASEIARDTSGMLELESLLNNAVNMVLERFGFYHASIFLIDPLGEYAVLRESTGDAGARMKNVGHKLAVGSNSIVGQATSRGETLVVNEVRRYEFYYPNPLLPDTRAEMAIPLKIANRVLGALDVQSTKVNTFTPEDVQTLQILADQLATAILNAELYTSAQETLAQHRFLHQISAAASSSQNVEEALRTTAQGMQVARKDDRVSIHLLNDNGELVLSALAGFPTAQRPKEVIPLGEGIIGRVALEKSPARVADVQTDPFYVPTGENIHSQLAVPIIYTDRLMGVLNLESEKVAAYTENDEEILSTMGSNLGSIIANAQLVSRVQNQVERQRQIFEITAKIRRSADMNSILETSTSELAKALRAQKAAIRISLDADHPAEIHDEQHPIDNDGQNNGSKSNGKGS